MFTPVVMDTMISSAFPLSVVDYMTRTLNRVKNLLHKKKRLDSSQQHSYIKDNNIDTYLLLATVLLFRCSGCVSFVREGNIIVQAFHLCQC